MSDDNGTQKKHQLQLITYGAPGTGKSHHIDSLTDETNSIRVTFHPDTDYSTFVGAYKPTMAVQERYALDATGQTHKIDADEKAISYSFVPQAFLKAYVKAWRRWCDTKLDGDEKVFYLVIEEINRGNCAQIFGDLFQLLDRSDNGWSSYAITPDDDIRRFLSEDKDWNLSALALTDAIVNDDVKTIATADQITSGKRMVLPPNFRIYATMNTSDQSLFPIDSAFKRRWDWEYMPIKDEGKKWKIVVGENADRKEYGWWSFLAKINEVIANETGSEDKQLGYYFVKAKGGEINAKTFVGKVAFYLWGDVFKDNLPNLDAFKIKFDDNGVSKEREIRFSDFHKGDTDKLVAGFLDALGVDPTTPAENPDQNANQ